jgi:predicted Zn-dependent protease
VAVPLAQVAEIEMPAPPEYAAALKALEGKKVPEAMVAAQAIVARYGGLPTAWAMEATTMVGDLHLEMRDPAKAEAAYAAAAKLYPGQGNIRGDIAAARIALSKKDFDGAKAKLAPILEKGMSEKNLVGREAQAYAVAFLVSGQAKEESGETQGALEDYLRASTVFGANASAAADAQARADALRKKAKERGQTLTVP